MGISFRTEFAFIWPFTKMKFFNGKCIHKMYLISVLLPSMGSGVSSQHLFSNERFIAGRTRERFVQHVTQKMILEIISSGISLATNFTFMSVRIKSR
jgi:hypothetical protein